MLLTPHPAPHVHFIDCKDHLLSSCKEQDLLLEILIIYFRNILKSHYTIPKKKKILQFIHLVIAFAVIAADIFTVDNRRMI